MHLNVTNLLVYFARCFRCFISSSERCSAKPRHRSMVPCSSSCRNSNSAVTQSTYSSQSCPIMANKGRYRKVIISLNYFSWSKWKGYCYTNRKQCRMYNLWIYKQLNINISSNITNFDVFVSKHQTFDGDCKAVWSSRRRLMQRTKYLSQPFHWPHTQSPDLLAHEWPSHAAHVSPSHLYKEHTYITETFCIVISEHELTLRHYRLSDQQPIRAVILRTSDPSY